MRGRGDDLLLSAPSDAGQCAAALGRPTEMDAAVSGRGDVTTSFKRSPRDARGFRGMLGFSRDARDCRKKISVAVKERGKTPSYKIAPSDTGDWP